MSKTTPRPYVYELLDDAQDSIGRAAGDHGIDASDDNARILHDCIERQQRVIGELARIVTELRAEVASLGRVLASRTEHLV